MFNVPQGWHSDSDTVSNRSVSVSPPWYVLCAPGGAQRRRQLKLKLSLGRPLWYVYVTQG